MVQPGTEVNREDTAPALPICPFGPVPCPVSPGIHGQCQQAFPSKLHSSFRRTLSCGQPSWGMRWDRALGYKAAALIEQG